MSLRAVCLSKRPALLSTSGRPSNSGRWHDPQFATARSRVRGTRLIASQWGQNNVHDIVHCTSQRARRGILRQRPE
jgi:hypothetical protein